jgi:alanine dehydrogenase
MDIVVTATPSREPIVKRDWISSGMHINSIGADAPGKEELDPEILKISKIVVDDIEQAAHGGEINVPLSKGIISLKNVYAELGEIVAGFKFGRESIEEITVFCSTGLAIQDAVTAKLVYDKALEKNVGQWIEFF